jgi:hypothetical protein
LLEDIYVKILAFSSYGFPESHAISFAYLVYASAWLKCYYPAAFRAALLCAQPMGFYAPASLIGDVRGHGVTVRGADVNASGVLATLEKTEDPLTGNGALPPDSPPAGGVPVPGQPVIRLGLSEVRNLGTSAAEEIVEGQPYADLEDFARRTTVGVAALEALALGGAFGCFGVSRREALWAAGAAATIRPGQLPGTTLGMTAEAGDVPDLGEHHQRGELPDAGQRGQHLDPRVGFGVRAYLAVQPIDRDRQRIEGGEAVGDDLPRHRRKVELGQPAAAGPGPVAAGPVASVIGGHRVDPVLQLGAELDQADPVPYSARSWRSCGGAIHASGRSRLAAAA